MNILPTACIVFGILIILGRGPLLIAPETTLNIIRGFISKTRNLRIIGCSTLLIGVILITTAVKTPQVYPVTVLSLGCLFAVVGGLLVLIPSVIQKLAVLIWSMSARQARVLGVISVLLGAYLIYLGINTL